jgi:glucokinase
MRIGIDLGGTNISGGIVNIDGKILTSYSIPTEVDKGSNKIIENIVSVIRHLIAKKNSNQELHSIGIGVPGIVDKKGVVLECVNLNWRNVPLKKIIEEETGYNTYLANDATVAALAEASFGSLMDIDTAVLITLGTGVGGGYIINGKMMTSPNGLASEIGHMVVGNNNVRCNCGRIGCLETYTSSTALIRNAKIEIINAPHELIAVSKFHRDYYKNLNEITGKIIFQYAKDNDPIAYKVVDDLAKYLAIGIGNLIALIDPQVISIGGGLSKAGDFLISVLSKKLESERIFKSLSPPLIKLAKLHNDAGIIGAAFIDKYVEKN